MIDTFIWGLDSLTNTRHDLNEISELKTLSYFYSCISATRSRLGRGRLGVEEKGENDREARGGGGN